VIGGASDDADRFAPVGSVTRIDEDGKVSGVFSGVLISPRLALTAAHVVCGGARCEAQPSAFRFNLVQGGNIVTLRIAQIVVHEGYDGFGQGPGRFTHNDLALLRLAAPAPVRGYTIAPMRPGDELTLVGHGAHGAFGERPAGASVALRHYGTNVFDRALAADVYGFDAAEDGSSGVQLAGGDSGGAALVRIRGEYYLAGINTFVFTASGAGTANGAFQGGGGMTLMAYVPWLRQVTDAMRASAAGDAAQPH
jgi:hypothetical protein